MIKHLQTAVNKFIRIIFGLNGRDSVKQWFSNLSEVSNPTGVMQAYIEPLIITRSGSRKF